MYSYGAAKAVCGLDRLDLSTGDETWIYNIRSIQVVENEMYIRFTGKNFGGKFIK